MQERRRLSRDRDGRMLGGVCAGIARHYDYDVTVVRIVFVLLALLSGFGIIVYLAMWLLVPAAPREEMGTRQVMRDNRDEMTERARLAADSARAAAEAARQAANQLAEATRAAATAARDTWQQGSQSSQSAAKPGETTPDGSQSTWPPDRPMPETDVSSETSEGAASPGSEGSMEPQATTKPGETTPEGADSSWPPDRPLPETDAPAESSEQRGETPERP
jgi:phage shock protein C